MGGHPTDTASTDGKNDGHTLESCNTAKTIASRIGIISRIGNNVLARVAGHQRRGLGHIMTRTCRQGKTQREKRIIHRSMEFRGKATAAPTECF